MMKHRRSVKFFVILALLIAFAGALYFAYSYVEARFTVKNAYVEGSRHYTDEEIKEIVMDGRYGNNSLYLSHKYKNKEIDGVPFVETISVNIVSDDTIMITVYEKAVAGFIEYLGRYIYFDKDGIVVEVSNVKTAGVPEVVGIDFDYVVLHEVLPVANEDLFKDVLKVTQLMEKYGVDAGKMYFSNMGDIFLYKDDVTISLGREENLDIKIMNLPSILANLNGKKGTLRMENYNEGTSRVSFEVNE